MPVAVVVSICSLSDTRLIFRSFSFSTVSISCFSERPNRCVGYLAHPFVKWMVLLLIASFVSPLEFFIDEGVQDHFVYLQVFAKAIFYLRGSGREKVCLKHSKNNTVALSTHSPQVVLLRCQSAQATLRYSCSPPKASCSLPYL